ncbi:MAG TPA: GntR family transcriptional regulator, partial [Rhizobiales bacterium]|nr:GntR family transcriptional regulator [Hyphomicrobiales bacterium]
MQKTKDKTNIGISTYAAIRKDIIFGQLEPDEKLKLEALKTRYGTSVSTLREMLNRLSSEGFVIAREQRGFFVAPVSPADMREIADLRILIEGHALEKSINNGDTEWEGQIVAAHHKLQRTEQMMLAGDESVKETWKRYDWGFHQTLIQACNSRTLMDIHATVFDKYLRYQLRVLTFRGEIAAREHRQLL